MFSAASWRPAKRRWLSGSLESLARCWCLKMCGLLRLFPGEIVTFSDYLSRSARFRSALAPHVQHLLGSGISIVFDFAGNISQERFWAKSLCDGANVHFVLHYLKASDALCKAQLRRRNAEQPDGSQPTTDEEFDAITKYFVPPSPAEGFDVREYDADLLWGTASQESL
jgi:hypothetical protein